MANKIVAGDVVVVGTSSGGMSWGTCYSQGIVLGIGSFLKRDKIHYSIKYVDGKLNKDGIILTVRSSIKSPILSKQPHIPRIAIDDTLSLKNNCIAVVKYIGKSLANSLTEEPEQKSKNWGLEQTKSHKNAEILYNNSDNEIYVALEVLNSDNTPNSNNKGGIIDEIRYFYTDSNNECILMKASGLTKFCVTSKYDLLLNGYLSQYTTYRDILAIIQKYIQKSIGFRIQKLWAENYSFGTCSITTYKADYAVFDIDDNYYGPLIHIEFVSSYKRAGKKHSTSFDGLYQFQCSGEGHVRDDNHGMTQIKSISIKKTVHDGRKLNIKFILNDMANTYGVDENILLKELKRCKLKLHGVNINKIEGLSKAFNCFESEYMIRYQNDALIEKIRERDKDKIICFDGNGMVLMSNGSRKKIGELKIGDAVMSLGNKVSMIECRVLNIINKEIEMVKLVNEINNSYFWITFEHPILIEIDSGIGHNIDNNKLNGLKSLNSNEINKYGLQWILPKNLYQSQLRYQTNVYNFILNSNHTINVNGFWCCTLGHDYTGKIIQHKLWGNNKNIKQHLQYYSATYPDVVVHG